jgi:hypothetical protein
VPHIFSHVDEVLVLLCAAARNVEEVSPHDGVVDRPARERVAGVATASSSIRRSIEGYTLPVNLVAASVRSCPTSRNGGAGIRWRISDVEGRLWKGVRVGELEARGFMF